MPTSHTLSTSATPPHSDAVHAYLFDMIDQLAQIARNAGEMHMAIHLEAIIAVQRFLADDPTA